MREDGFGDDIDNGVRSSDLGSSFPEGSYRPVPIVWFAAAYIGQSILLIVLFSFLINLSGLVIVAASALATLWIGELTFRRGMAQAGRGWRVATITMLLANLGLVSFGAMARGS